MRRLIVLSALGALAGMTGCTTVSKSDYKTAQIVLKESPTARRHVVSECIADINRASAVDKANLGAFMNVSVSRVPSAFCNRLLSAMANGHLSYDDLFTATRSGNYAKLIRVLQGH